MTSNASKTDFWDRRRGIIKTRKGGGWSPGKGLTSHGYSMLDELVGRASFFQVLMLHVTGRMPGPQLAQWLEATFLCLSWPDPRMWPNYIASLAGASRVSAISAICGGTMASDSQIYGPGTALASVRFITTAMERHNHGWTVEQILKTTHNELQRPAAPGYIRPLATGDERVAVMQRLADQWGFAIGPHLELAYRIQDWLYEHFHESMNLAGYMAAFLSDQGFSAQECYRMSSLCVNAGVHACYVEAADRPPESFLPLRCDDIEYQGKPERTVPDK